GPVAVIKLTYRLYALTLAAAHVHHRSPTKYSRIKPAERRGSMVVPPLARSLPFVIATLLVPIYAGLMGTAVSAERRNELVRYDDIQIEVVVEGEGPAVVLLPSLARDSDDYDEVAEGLSAAGFRVLRPKPRGIGRSSGPMTKVSLHD